MDDPIVAQGGVVMADNPGTAGPPDQSPPVEPPLPPEPDPVVPDKVNRPMQETIVVPSQEEPNPFIPKTMEQQSAPVEHVESSPPPPPPSSYPPVTQGNPMIKRILMIVVFLVVILGLVALGRFVLGYFTKAQPVTITYWGLWEDASIIQSTIGEFERLHPTIQVEYVKQSHVQYRERLQTQIEQNQGPDVFRFHNTWVPMIARDLSPVPASVMTPSAFASTFYPVASKDLVAGSTIYGMPMEIDGLGLYYNEDLLQAAGVTPPTTWEDVLNMVPQLTAKGSDGTITTSAIALGSANNVENFSDILATMIMQNGGSLTNPTGTETEQALTFFHNFADPANPVYTWNDGLDNSVFAFASGRVAMILAPSWRAFEIKQISPTLRFKIAPIPQLPGNSVSWASYWVEGVNAKGNHQEASWEFVKFLTSKEGATKMFTEASKLRLFGEPYARVDMKDSILNDQYVGAFVKDADHARSFPLASRTFDNGLNDHMIKYLVDAVNSMSQGSAPSSVLGTLEQGFQQVLGSYGLISNSAPTQ